LIFFKEKGFGEIYFTEAFDDKFCNLV